MKKERPSSLICKVCVRSCGPKHCACAQWVRLSLVHPDRGLQRRSRQVFVDATSPLDLLRRCGWAGMPVVRVLLILWRCRRSSLTPSRRVFGRRWWRPAVIYIPCYWSLKRRNEHSFCWWWRGSTCWRIMRAVAAATKAGGLACFFNYRESGADFTPFSRRAADCAHMQVGNVSFRVAVTLTFLSLVFSLFHNTVCGAA